MAIDRRAKREAGKAGEPVSVGKIMQPYPSVVSFLSDTVYRDGSGRVTGTLLMFVEAGLWKACLRDRDLDEVAFVSADTPEGVLSAMESGIKDGDLEWRPSGNNFKGGKKKS